MPSSLMCCAALQFGRRRPSRQDLEASAEEERLKVFVYIVIYLELWYVEDGNAHVLSADCPLS